MPLQFDSTFAGLPAQLFQPATPTPVKEPSMVAANTAFAQQLGFEPAWLSSPGALQALSGNALLQGQSPIAMAYAGHQFGNWVPSLGDGRAILIGEVVGENGTRYDLHLKGAGRTPYSRNGDGRATLGAMLREYVVSEAMAALGIPTTRSLAVIETGGKVLRQELLPGAVLTRVARSHVRVGTFQYLAAREEDTAMRALTDYEIARNFPGAPQDEGRYRWFVAEVIARQAHLIARWMNVGFIHGVMNTDNMSVCGETIDYGPCAFMDVFHPQKVFSSIDQYGRYAWDRQPVIALWNLTRLAEALLPLLDTSRENAILFAQDELKKFMPAFEQAFEQGMRDKLGLLSERDEDPRFIAQTLQHMIESQADFTVFFSSLTDVAEGRGPGTASEWLELWRSRVANDGDNESLRVQTMRCANPIFIARNHRVEQAIAAANLGDLKPFHRLVSVIARPFERQPENADYAKGPTEQEEVHQTFCGT